MSALLTFALAFTATLIFCSRRLARYLRVLQQDEYNSRRMLEWVSRNSAYDTRGTVVLSVVVLASFFAELKIVSLLISLAGAAALITLAKSEPDPRVSGKIKLNMTDRAQRIYRTAFFMIAALSFGVGFLGYWAEHAALTWAVQILVIQSVPRLLAFAVDVLKPGEDRRQLRYLEEAAAKVRRIDPLIIGITGSYGKTSVKNMLGELLQTTKGATFWPKRGVNTLMGNTRIIREDLKPSHEFAVIEMGAYRRGSIERVCELTPPKGAIITAIGNMHLERFGSRENIYRAKTELARAVPEDGILVCNGDDSFARRAAEEFQKKTTILYGFDRTAGKLDVWIDEIKVDPEGTSFKIHWKGKGYAGHTKLLGRPALSNIMAAFSMACALEADPQFVLAAISNLAPVDNRLSVIKTDKIVQLNDAYNSNPIGFAAALDVLEAFPGQRKILVTPGMIELGEEQTGANATAASRAAEVCDLVMLVGTTNREALKEGLKQKKYPDDKVLVFDDRDEALNQLRQLQKSGDVILLENDLPDVFEEYIRF
ncbi:MAG: UDP-N-acetylmuramoyl-tripeptide--D-alanyl-D-alanine ligase [Bdellovibrionales bacterium]|nr:UDP-N-acetylmuramoyl-tripeptide--D-alanyl-D-alanine ligase [Bdellovibrionales bacterium]